MPVLAGILSNKVWQIHWFNVLEVLSEFGTYYSIKLGSLFSNSSINYFPDFFLFSVFSP